MRTKIESLLGFAVKAGKVIYGGDTLETTKAKYHLIFLCNSVADNMKKKVLAVAEKKQLPIIVTEEKELQNIVGRCNCKALAVTDKQMATAMLGFLSEGYRLISSEVK